MGIPSPLGVGLPPVGSDFSVDHFCWLLLGQGDKVFSQDVTYSIETCSKTVFL